MPTKRKTTRRKKAPALHIGSPERKALERLSEAEGRPIDQLIADAIKAFVLSRAPKQRSMKENLDRLREYQKRDPGYKKAFAAFVEAEATIKDPLEGETFEARMVDGQLEPIGPLQRRMRELLGA
jgi:hypothetical protein